MIQEPLVEQNPALHATTSPESPIDNHAPRELGDVIDALDEAAASLKAVVRSQTRSIVDEADQFVRSQPWTALAIAGALGYLFARISR